MIWDYHRDVFLQFGVSKNAWTPDFALESLATVAEREAYWDTLLAPANILDATNALIAPTEVDSSLAAITWRAEVALAGTQAIFTGSNSFGPYDVLLPGGGHMIGDGLNSSVIAGTAENDVLMGFAGTDTLIGLFGEDRLWGGVGVDVLHGGEGDDILHGEEGPDLLYDRGTDEFPQDDATLFQYDGEGDDKLFGGAGSDILVYSGGTDEFSGGTGDDTYIVSPEFLVNRTSTDQLSIILSEDPDDQDSWFGHDYVLGNGAGIHEIVFEGLNRDDVTFTYEYTETPFDELDSAVQTQFLSLLGIESLDLGTYPIFSLQGGLTITVNATGSSIFFDMVSGAYVGGANNPGGNIYVPPIIATQTYAVFEDGTYFDWAGEVGLINFIQPINGTLDDTADDAPESQASERGTPTDETRVLFVAAENGGTTTGTDYADAIYGQNGDDSLIGLTGNDLLDGSAGADSLDGGDGDDTIEGGAGADLILGGNGSDAASYVNSGSAVSVDLGAQTATGGDAAGDTLIGIEDLIGSRFADSLKGDLNNSALEGGSGNDTLDGGAGTDLASYAGSASAVSVDLASLTLSGGDAAGDTLISIEGIIGSDWNDDLRGDGQANVIFGGDGADYVLGRDGDDQISGDAGNDNLNGGNGNDTIIGGAGNDTIYGDAGDDHIEGGDGDDVLLGRSGLNGLWGQAGNDELYGDSGSDYLDGGDGDDTLYASGGTDGVIGGAGIDTYSAFPILGNNYNRLTIDLSAGSATGVEIGTDVLMSIENVIGSSHVDTIIGDANANRLDGGTQDDSLVGGAGNDTLIGGWHDDELFGGDGDDELHGDDYLGQTGYAGNDTISGGAGTDTAVFGAALAAVTVALNGNVLTLTSTLDGTDEVSNDVEILTFNGVSYTWTDIANIALGSDGIVTGTPGDDTIDLNYTDSLGESVHDSTTPADTVMADAGNDTVLLYAGDDTGYGEAGDDTIVGGAGTDTLYGGLGNDSLDGGTGNDSLEGGDGSDIYLYLAGDGSDVVNDTGPSQDTDRIVFADIASTAVTYTSNGPDLMVHLPDGSVVTLRNQFGPGTTGIEQLQYSDNVTVNPDALGFAVPIYGTSGNDNLSGTSGNDTIHGLDGNDTVQGGDGADYLYGDGGNDTIVAGLGIDYFDGGDGHDMLNTGYTSAATVVDLVAGTVTFAATLTETAVNFEDAVTGNGNDQVTGNADNNLIITNGGNDVLSGGAGNDSLSGGSGADTLLGGDGDDHIKADIGIDVFDGGNGRDLLDTTYTSANVIVDLGAGTVNFAAQLTETATNFEDAKTAGGADQLLGTAADNTLTSGAGNDLLVGAGGYDGLNGEAGNDTLNGGAGDDTLTGGTGADRFVFDFSSGGNDIITDFNQLDGGAEESDLLVFQGLLVGTFSYLGSGAFTGGSDNSEARVSGNQVLVDANGDGLSDFDITLTGLTNANQLGVDDFLFTV